LALSGDNPFGWNNVSNFLHEFFTRIFYTNGRNHKWVLFKWLCK